MVVLHQSGTSLLSFLLYLLKVRWVDKELPPLVDYFSVFYFPLPGRDLLAGRQFLGVGELPLG